MIQGIINDILEAEKKAEEIIKEAESFSSKDTEKVDKKIVTLNEENMLCIKNTRKSIIEKANLDSKNFYDEEIKKANLDAQKMQKDAKSKIEEIANKLVGRIVD